MPLGEHVDGAAWNVPPRRCRPRTLDPTNEGGWLIGWLEGSQRNEVEENSENS